MNTAPWDREFSHLFTQPNAKNMMTSKQHWQNQGRQKRTKRGERRHKTEEQLLQVGMFSNVAAAPIQHDLANVITAGGQPG